MAEVTDSILNRLPHLRELEAALGKDLRERDLLRKLVKVLRDYEKREEVVKQIRAARAKQGETDDHR